MREMKDSGVSVVPRIPMNWDVTKIKYILEERNERAFHAIPEQLLSVSEYYGVAPRADRIKSDEVLVRADSLDGYKICKRNDLVINIMLAWKGALGASAYDGIVSPAYCVHYAKNDNVCMKYLQYLFTTDAYKNYFRQHSSGIIDSRLRLYTDVMYGLWCIIPPLEEQIVIAKYLDSKCTEIDTLVADIQSQIDTLEQYKRSVITEAVTKGLDYDAEMKDSGIEWVGKIPATWDIHPIYYYFGERKNKNYALAEQNLLSLSYGRVIRKSIDTVGGLLPASFNTYNIVETGDIIIRPTDLQNDKRSLRTGLVTEHGIITSAYIDLMPKGNVNSEYFHYLLHAYDIQKVFYNMGNGVRQGLNYSEFSKLMVIAPPIEEQTKIVEHLDSRCREINEIITEKKEQLVVLAEYKKSLIYEYVTGKKEVPMN